MPADGTLAAITPAEISASSPRQRQLAKDCTRPQQKQVYRAGRPRRTSVQYSAAAADDCRELFQAKATETVPAARQWQLIRRPARPAFRAHDPRVERCARRTRRGLAPVDDCTKPPRARHRPPKAALRPLRRLSPLLGAALDDLPRRRAGTHTPLFQARLLGAGYTAALETILEFMERPQMVHGLSRFHLM